MKFWLYSIDWRSMAIEIIGEFPNDKQAQAALERHVAERSESEIADCVRYKTLGVTAVSNKKATSRGAVQEVERKDGLTMPVDWSKYPDDWKEIAKAIKDATDWKCQVCGKQCYRPGENVERTQDVLTVAHVNHVESDCRQENLVAACSVCHLRYDAERKRWQRLAMKRIKSESNNLLF